MIVSLVAMTHPKEPDHIVSSAPPSVAISNSESDSKSCNSCSGSKIVMFWRSLYSQASAIEYIDGGVSGVGRSSWNSDSSSVVTMKNIEVLINCTGTMSFGVVIAVVPWVSNLLSVSLLVAAYW